jgi:hypothetical protein
MTCVGIGAAIASAVILHEELGDAAIVWTACIAVIGIGTGTYCGRRFTVGTGPVPEARPETPPSFYPMTIIISVSVLGLARMLPAGGAVLGGVVAWWGLTTLGIILWRRTRVSG